jgi:hypothetical protein
VEQLKVLSTEELRAELWSRSNFRDGLYATKARAMIARDPRPDLFEIKTGEIISEIKFRLTAIYGEDDRIESYQLTDQRVLSNAKSVAAIFDASEINPNNDGTTVSLPKKNLAQDFSDNGRPLCDDEKFRLQPSGAIGTAFLIGEDLVATAAHNLNNANLHDRLFIFGYQMVSENIARTKIPRSDVYKGVNILDWRLDEKAADWAVVKLNRKVEDHTPLITRKKGKINDGESVYVIGHPAGLPQKFASNARVRENTHTDFFVANLDTYGGNSGSPVFNLSTHEVEGILVRGEVDFVPNVSCFISLPCPINGCRGEDCTRITLIEHLIP